MGQYGDQKRNRRNGARDLPRRVLYPDAELLPLFMKMIVYLCTDEMPEDTH